MLLLVNVDVLARQPIHATEVMNRAPDDRTPAGATALRQRGTFSPGVRGCVVLPHVVGAGSWSVSNEAAQYVSGISVDHHRGVADRLRQVGYPRPRVGRRVVRVGSSCRGTARAEVDVPAE